MSSAWLPAVSKVSSKASKVNDRSLNSFTVGNVNVLGTIVAVVHASVKSIMKLNTEVGKFGELILVSNDPTNL